MVMEGVEGSLGAGGGGEVAMGEEGGGLLVWEEGLGVDCRRALELCWRRALTRLVIGAIWERRRESSEVSMYLGGFLSGVELGWVESLGAGVTYSAFECAMLGSVSTSSSSSAMLSSYAVAMGMARSTMPSMIACMTILASPLCLSTVSEDWRRFRIGSSITSAECSKKETNVLLLWRNMDTCSTDTMRPLGLSVECSSM